MPDDDIQSRIERLKQRIRAMREHSFSATARRVIWADGALQHLRAYADRLSVPLALAAAPFIRGRMWQVFNCARAEYHCCERFGRSARWLRNLAAIGRGLDTLPGLERAITGDDGEEPIGRTFAVLLTKVATPESAEEWTRLARTLSIRDFEAAVRQARQAKSAWPVGPSSKPCADTTAASEPAETPDERPPRTEVRFYMPGPMRVAFDEGLQLHRAVSGREVPVSDFIEALVAESMTGLAPANIDNVDDAADVANVADVANPADAANAADWANMANIMNVALERLALKRGRSVATVERELARASDGWSWLDRSTPSILPDDRPRDRRFERLQRDTRQLLQSLEAVTSASTPGTPVALNARLRGLIDLENRVERQIGEWLDYMSAKDGWRRLGFDSLAHYGAERLTMGRRTAEDRARAARVLKRLPLLRASYEEERVGLEKVLLVARAIGPGPVHPKLERAWVGSAEESSVKRLRDEVRVVMREWLTHDSWKPREPLGDDEWRRSIALFPGTTRRRFERLVGVAGSSRMRDSVTWLRLRLVEAQADDLVAATADRCLRLTAAARTLSAVHTDAGASQAAPAAPSETDVPRTLSAMPSETDAARTLSVVPSITDSPRTLSVDDADAEVPANLLDPSLVSSATPLAVRTAVQYVSRGLDVPAWVGLMALLEEYITTWDPPATGTPSRHAAIYQRDGYRCTSPLCLARRNLHAHHVQLQSQGGGDEPTNLITLCAFCHLRGMHGTLAAMTGKAPLGNLFRLGRADVAEWYRNERRVPAPAVGPG